MNRFYRTIWSQRLGSWVAVPEQARAKGKAGGGQFGVVVGGLLILATGLLGTPHAGAQLPTGGNVTAGSATLVQNSASEMTIQQSTPRAAISWQGFSIGAGKTVQFVQPSASAVALNRVLGPDPSTIQGALKANGQVFLVNPNGVLFSPTAQVNVGSLVATTRSLADAAFMNPRLNPVTGSPMYTFDGDGTASVVNQGSITTAPRGFVAMMAARVVNETVDPALPASISAPGGSVLLGAGNTVTLDTGGPARMTIDRGALDAEIRNGSAIRAEGGTIYLSARGADALNRAVINQDGRLDTTTLQRDAQGRIVLDVAGGALLHGGTTRADGPQGGRIEVRASTLVDSGQWLARGTAGMGGTIDIAASQHVEQTAAGSLDASGTRGGGSARLTSGGTAWLSGGMAASSSEGMGGRVSTTAPTLTLAGAQLRADGATGGGQVRAGGGWQGADGDLPNAQVTTVGAGAQLSASSTAQGDGGTVVVWSDRRTLASGSISARGAGTGDGGRVEVSSHGDLGFGASVDVGAPQAKAGALLLDPANIVIGESTDTHFSTIDLLDPSPSPGNSFGSGGVLELGNGNFVVNSPLYDLTGAADAGAVRLYSAGGVLLSTLTGSRTNDQVGMGGVLAVGSTLSNFVVSSPNWQNGSIGNAGAVTWRSGSGAGSTSSTINSLNSLVGTHTNDFVSQPTINGSKGLYVLSDGNYVVASPQWYGRTGAVTWGNGDAPAAAVIGLGNSLIGASVNDEIGNGGITLLQGWNSGFVVSSYKAGLSGQQAGAGAVTWMSNDGVTASGQSIQVASVNPTESNSLVGQFAGDFVGSGGIFALPSGAYVVASPSWTGKDHATTNPQGAFTWLRPHDVGRVSSLNSLVSDKTPGLGPMSRVVVLTNGNYVVALPNWNADRGAVAWGNGTTGIMGVISAANSIVGNSSADSLTRYAGITALTNGNYVIVNVGDEIGSVTWVDGTSGKTSNGTRTISSSNSVIGAAKGDLLYAGATALTDGNYVVAMPSWGGSDLGAVTWFDGVTGKTRAGNYAINTSTSLLGTRTGDSVGSAGVIALAGGNYLVLSPTWDNGSAVDAGAVTWVRSGGLQQSSDNTLSSINATNSLIGSTRDDRVGGGSVTVLAKSGNFLVSTPLWDLPAADQAAGLVDVGAVTWGDATTGVSGVISGSNSLVGAKASDQVGSGGIIELPSGNYVVSSPLWDNGSLANVGAVIQGSGTTGLTGPIDPATSYTGLLANDRILASALARTRTDGAVAVRTTMDTGTGRWVRIVTPQLTSSITGSVPYAYLNGQDLGISARNISDLLLAGTDLSLQATNNITVASAIEAGGTSGVLTLEAGRDILLNAGLTTGAALTLLAGGSIEQNENANIRTGGALDLKAGGGIVLRANIMSGANVRMVANDPLANDAYPTQYLSGINGITMASGTSIDAGIHTVSLIVREGLSSETAGDITIGPVRAGALHLQSPLFAPSIRVDDKTYDGSNAATPASTSPLQYEGLILNASGLSLQAVDPRFLSADASDQPVPVTANLQLVDTSRPLDPPTPLVQLAFGGGTIRPRTLSLAGAKVEDGEYFFTASLGQMTMGNVLPGQSILPGGWIRTTVKLPGTYAGYDKLTDTSQFRLSAGNPGTKLGNYLFGASSTVGLTITASTSGGNSGGADGGSGDGSGGDSGGGGSSAGGNPNTHQSDTYGQAWQAETAKPLWVPDRSTGLPLEVRDGGIRARVGLTSAEATE